jgi:hypothetical protein
VSLTYLLHIEAQMSSEAIKARFPFADYSARYWMGLMRLAQPASEALQELASRLFSNEEQYRKWISIFNPERPWERQPSRVFHLPPPLYYASLEGLPSAVATLLEKGAEINAQGGDYGNALQAACYGGHENVAAMLLEKGAEINAQGGIYGNALQAACDGGYEKVAAMLLEKGATRTTEKKKQ